jgi:hypothetical protein
MLPSIWWLGALRGFSPIGRERESTLRRVQLEEGFGLGFLPARRSDRFGYSLRFMG